MFHYFLFISFFNQGAPVEPTKLRVVLNTLMKGLSGSSLSTIETIISHWPEIIDKSLYPFCTPVSVHGSCLTISVSDPGLFQEVQWQSDKILEAVNPLFSDERITQINVSLHSE
tara:strand:+ start:2297 stop:2638 length:342 start_codon:yes stop_codon:yes gene_type:complete